MPNSVNVLDISRVSARVAPDKILSDKSVRGSVVHREDLQPYWKSKKVTFL